MNATVARQPDGLLGRIPPALRHGYLVAVAVAFWAGSSFADEPGELVINAEAQENVARLLESVIGGDGNIGAGTKLVRNYVDAEAAFREASKLMPWRLDVRFGIASSLVCEALQTSGQQLRIKVNGALRVYQEIHDLDPNGFDAPILYAAFARAIGDSNASEGAIRGLMGTHARRTEEYLQRFNRTDRILQTALNKTPGKIMPSDKHHAIVVLGAGLETNGTAKAKLVARLQQALNLARIYPNAPMILTGGNPKNGITEAYAMRLWLAEKGISGNRFILEDRAKDTVENALYSAKLLQNLGATHVTLVTSSSHVRRGLVDLQEACLLRGLNLQYDTLAAEGGGDAHLDQEQERVGVYRDLVRVSGLWDIPGIRR
jgi:vancomycin permeability regulator SanA